MKRETRKSSFIKEGQKQTKTDLYLMKFIKEKFSFFRGKKNRKSISSRKENPSTFEEDLPRFNETNLKSNY